MKVTAPSLRAARSHCVPPAVGSQRPTRLHAPRLVALPRALRQVHARASEADADAVAPASGGPILLAEPASDGPIALLAETTGAEPTPAAAAAAPAGDTVKAALLDAVCGTQRGTVARSEVRAEINELVNQLEVSGGRGADVKSFEFEGAWELLYTNAADMLALLSVNRLPLLPLKIGAVTQTIDADNCSVENSVELQFPLLRTSLSTVSTYNVASPKRLQYTVQRGVLHTPSIEGSLELPSTLTLLGQTVDLGPLRELLAPLAADASRLAASAGDLLGQAPDLEVPLQSSAWQLTTYLDADLRVARGDGGSLYVFRKLIRNPE